MTVLLVEVAALLALGAVGWALVGPARGPVWRSLVALPAGIAAMTLVVLVLLVGRTSLAYPWLALAVAVVAAAVVLVRRRSGAGASAPGSARVVAISVGVLLAVAVGTALVPLVNLTADSFRFMPSSHALATDGNLADVSLHLLSTRNLVVPSLQGLAVSEFGYLRAVGPLFGVVTLGLLWWLVRDGTRQLGPDTAQLLGLGSVALLATSSRFLFSTFYLNGHVLFACWLLLVVTVVRRMLLEPEAATGTSDAWLVALLGAGLALLRAEGGLLAVIAVTPLLVDPSVPLRQRRIVLVGIGAVMTAWQMGVLLPRALEDPNGPELSVVGLGLLGVALIAFAAVVDVVARRLPRPLLVAQAVLWLGTLGLATGDFEARNSVRAIWNNLTVDGLWGGSLLVLGALLVLAVAARRIPAERALVFPLVAFAPFALLLSFLRGHPYRIGPGDSLNRMLVHVVPIAILAVALSAAGESRWPGLRRRFGGAGPEDAHVGAAGPRGADG